MRTDNAPFSPIDILIAEDDALMRKSLRSLPRKAGERVLRKVAWHRNSWIQVVSNYFIAANSRRKHRKAATEHAVTVMRLAK